jgi:hypothetical protein
LVFLGDDGVGAGLQRVQGEHERHARDRCCTVKGSGAAWGILAAAAIVAGVVLLLSQHSSGGSITLGTPTVTPTGANGQNQGTP